MTNAKCIVTDADRCRLGCLLTSREGKAWGNRKRSRAFRITSKFARVATNLSARLFLPDLQHLLPVAGTARFGCQEHFVAPAFSRHGLCMPVANQLQTGERNVAAIIYCAIVGPL